MPRELKFVDSHGRQPLTTAQRAVYAVIVRDCLAGEVPGVRSIQRALKFKSPNAVRSHCRLLAAKGWIVYEGRANSIRPAVPEIDVRRDGANLTVATTGRVRITADALARLAGGIESAARAAA